MSGGANGEGSKTVLIVLLAVILIAAAVFGGFAGAGYLKNRSFPNAVSENEPSRDPVYDNTYEVTEGSYTALNMTPVTAVFVVNSETGRVDNVFIEILRCNEVKLDFIRLAPEISYTMSSSLYSELCAGNTQLPQTVTLSELYRYYHNDKAYEAGRKIISELINFNVLYYTGIYDKDFEKYISVSETSEEFTAEFNLTHEEACSDFGTSGSVKGVIEAGLSEVVTNRTLGERLRYLEVYEQLGPQNTAFTDAPLIEKNETVELSSSGMGAILYGILY